MPQAISCFGDSTSFGTGSSDPATKSYPSVLAGLLGRTTRNFGIPSESSTQIKDRVVADNTHMTDIVVLWMGHNDSDRNLVVTNVGLSVAHIVAVAGAANARYLIMSVLNRTPYEGAGTAGHAPVIAMNNAIQSAYRANYVDIRGFLVHQYPATPAGNAAHLTDLNVFYVDSIHLNDAGYQKIAERLATVITEKGW